MIKARVLLVPIASFLAGVVFVLSCGDGDSPDAVDAAVPCDCPVAEPPLAGRITRVTVQKEIAAMSFGGWIALCERGDTVLGGGCYAGTIVPGYAIVSSNPTPTFADEVPLAWACDVYNGTPNLVISSAYAICLKPAK